jgi:hypothetical protein
MTFAAFEMETVGTLVVVPVDELWVASVLDSVPGVAEPLDGVEGALLALAALGDDGRSAIAELGGTKAADGGTDPTDAVCDAVTLAEADGSEDGRAADVGEAAVDAPDGAAGATAVTTGEVVV